MMISQPSASDQQHLAAPFTLIYVEAVIVHLDFHTVLLQFDLVKETQCNMSWIVVHLWLHLPRYEAC